MRRDALHLLALSSLAVAQPLFDLLGRNPEFFAVRGSTRWDVILFALALTLLPPAVLAGLELVVGIVSARLRRGLHLVFVALLLALVALEALRRVGGLSAAVLLAFSAGIGAASAAAYARYRPLRSIASALAVAGAAFLGLFLLGSDVSTLTLSGEAHAQVATVTGRTPVVLVVLDEFPLNSLLDASGRVDPVRYPHFAALARGALWFRNATTVSDGTTYAVPAILSGRYPERHHVPLLKDYPHNLFTLLGGGYRLDASEAVTHLCPPRLCRSDAASFGSRMGTLASDTGLVYLHVLLPDSLARGLTSVSEGWRNFLHGDDQSEQVARFDRFLRLLRPSARPTLAAIHLLLPHSPWQYLPSGHRYTLDYPVPTWGTDEVWTRDAGIVLQNFQRHLLQVAYVDGLLGRLVARLRAEGMYDRSLLVVTADHGISFRPGGKRRPAWPRNLQDIAYVPLLVKLPHERVGRVVDRHVQTIDVLPTIARVLGARLPWPVDGRSLLGRGSEPVVAIQKASGPRIAAPAAVLLPRRRAALGRQLALFGSDEPAASLYGIGRFRKLLGRSVGTAVALADVRAEVTVRSRGDPVQVTGRISGGATPVHDVALAVSGRVVAVVPAFTRAGATTFWALVPDGALPAGARISALAVKGTPARPRFALLGSAFTYRN